MPFQEQEENFRLVVNNTFLEYVPVHQRSKFPGFADFFLENSLSTRAFQVSGYVIFVPNDLLSFGFSHWPGSGFYRLL